jgi:Xaa-Pro aminopeptidase
VALGKSGARIMVDPAVAPHAVSLLIKQSGGSVLDAPDPARLPRACKNAAEIAGSASVHRQDGAAMVRFLAWLDDQEPGSVDEIAAATRLEEARRSTGEAMQMPLRALSFDTISGGGPNAAIIHYRVNTRTNRRIDPGEMLLIDSGGQYVAGTTDITRTIAVGDVPDEQKRFFTLVLKGMIAISLLRFLRAPAAWTSTRLPESRCGRPGSILPTAPATVSAAISPCMKVRNRSRGAEPRNCCPA